MNLDNFVINTKIGEDLYSEIVQVTDEATSTKYSAKISKSHEYYDFSKEEPSVNEEEPNDLFLEKSILSKLTHPSILKYIGLSQEGFKNRPNPVIVTEFTSENSLCDILNSEKFNDTLKLINLYGIVSAMSFLHSNGIIHCNLNPKNIFLDSNFYPKIGGFNFAAKNFFHKKMLISECSPEYVAPEVFDSEKFEKSSDVYSFSIILFQIVSDQVSIEDIKEIVSRNERPPIDENIPNCYRSLIERCWNKDPSERPTFSDIQLQMKNDHEFRTESVNADEYQNYIDFIDRSPKEFLLANETASDKNIQEEEEYDHEDELLHAFSQSDSDSELLDVDVGSTPEITKQSEPDSEDEEKDVDVNEGILPQSFVESESDSFLQREEISPETTSRTANIEKTIDEYLASNDMQNLMQFIHSNCDSESASSFFDSVYDKSPEKFDEMCKSGIEMKNPVACHKYATHLLSQSDKTPESINEARKLLEESTSQNYPKSFFVLSGLLYNNFNEGKEAMKLAQKGSELGDKDSKFLLGYLVSKGVGTDKDFKKGVEIMLESGAQELCEKVPTDIALYYCKISKENEGDGSTETPEAKTAFQWFEKAFNQKQTPTSINNYGLCYYKGFGVPKDVSKAKEIFQIGADKDYALCKYHLFFILSETDPELSYKYLKEATFQGCPDAHDQYIYQQNKRDKDDLSKNKIELTNHQTAFLDEAAKSDSNNLIHRKASDNGNMLSTSVLAMKYSNENDPENTFKYMNMLIDSCTNYVVPMEYAVSLFKMNYFKESFFFFNKLAKINHPIALYYIGVMKFRGLGCEKNVDESYSIMKYLSDRGIDQAEDFINDHFND